MFHEKQKWYDMFLCGQIVGGSPPVFAGAFTVCPKGGGGEMLSLFYTSSSEILSLTVRWLAREGCV